MGCAESRYIACAFPSKNVLDFPTRNVDETVSSKEKEKRLDPLAFVGEF